MTEGVFTGFPGIDKNSLSGSEQKRRLGEGYLATLDGGLRGAFRIANQRQPVRPRGIESQGQPDGHADDNRGFEAERNGWFHVVLLGTWPCFYDLTPFKARAGCLMLRHGAKLSGDETREVRLGENRI